jgi:hypothetical protein
MKWLLDTFRYSDRIPEIRHIGCDESKASGKRHTRSGVLGAMATLQSFEEIEAWQKARELAREVAIDIGHLAKKEKELQKIRNERINKKLPVSDIVIVDGSKKRSASRI